MKKKTNDVQVSREKVRLLTEQLQVAQKILDANEVSLKELKTKVSLIVFRLLLGATEQFNLFPRTVLSTQNSKRYDRTRKNSKKAYNNCSKAVF
jgi:hypothetical protein